MKSGVCWLMTDGVHLRVRVTPKSAREAVEHIVETPHGHALGVRVRAVPEDGAANDAVARLLAQWTSVPKSRVQLVSGPTSRIKTFAVLGVGLEAPPFSTLRNGGSPQS